MDSVPTTISQLLERQAQVAPERPAVVCGDAVLNYGELNARANQLAHHLQSLGVGTETLVALCLERSVDLVVAIHGVLKAGGAYVPLDPGHPAERLRFILDDCRPTVLVTTAALVGATAGFGGAMVLVEQQREELAGAALAQPAFAWVAPDGRSEAGLRLAAGNARSARGISKLPPSDNPVASSGPENLAYVIYTSGSTGTPKGVLVEQRSVMNCVAALHTLTPLEADDAYLFKINHAFDASLVELLGPLVAGGRLVILPAGEERDPRKLLAAVERHAITHLVFVPSALQALLASASAPELAPLRGLRSLMVGGEVVSRGLIARMQAACPEARLLNVYGPTEATIAVTGFDLRGGFEGVSAPIGRAFANVRAGIFDEGLRPAAPGTAGELWLGGIAVARGYLNRPELNARHFVTDPASPGERWYRTGDLGRMLPDGNIEFLGRRDGQVKVRGYRIELGEVESRLAALPGIADAAVVAQADANDASGEAQLAAYYVGVGDKGLDPDELRQRLRQTLPPYMVPTLWRQMPSLPITSHGKRDISALPRIEVGIATGDGTLAEVWAQELGIERVGESDDFFGLGGHSLSAVRVASRLRAALGKDVSASDIYRAPTLAQFERVLDELPDLEEAAPDSRKATAGWFPLAYQQLDCWLLEKSHAPNLNVLERKRVAGRLDGARLAAALERVIAEHPALRYRISPRLPRQEVGEVAEAGILERDLSAMAPEEREAAALASLAELSRFTDWKPGVALVRLRMLRLGPEITEVQACMPHIVSDEASLKVFFDDLSRHYQDAAGVILGEDATYQGFVREQRAALRPTLARDRAFWESYLGDAAPIRFPEPEVIALASSESVYVEWPAPEVAALAGWARAHQASLPDCLHALALAAIAPYVHPGEDGGRAVAFYNPRSTRTSAAYDRTLGPLARLDCLKVDVAGACDLLALARRVRQAKLDTEEHQACPAAIKSASLYQQRWKKMPVRERLARLAARGATWLLPQAELDYEAALGLARMTILRSAPVPDYTLLVNVLNSFVAPPRETAMFGCALEAVGRLPSYPPPVERVLEIYFLREPNYHQRHLIMLNGDLRADLRRQLGENLLKAARRLLASSAPAR